MKNLAGFTLLELVITIGIIAVLSVVAVVNLSGVQQNTRDVKRQSDLRLIQGALEQYYADQHNYPTALGANLTSGSRTYLNQVPSDPNAVSGTGTNAECPAGTTRECIGKTGNSINAYCWRPGPVYDSGICNLSCPDAAACGAITSSPLQYVYAAKPDACDNSTTICTNYCLYGKMENDANATKGSPYNATCPSRTNYNYMLTQP